MGDPFGAPAGFDFMITVVPIIIVIGFAVVIGGIIFSGVKHAKNASSPQESTFAKIVAKRMDVRHHTNHHNHGNDGIGHMSSSSRTYYYITLEFENGTRREFLDVKNIYGLVAEGDSGYAATKGEWIVAFERSIG
ncbi:hypothetical protein B1748_20040 [Paenibacillus sp. MY03]|uniref:DUF2500 domain-containing protein n=1 Tax=Paenibacillus agaridevorans TaxID=171404 RepID=A0A2R5EW62_9BACL|nr:MULTISPECIES: DUF2500 domain-containing protein [Paenibacillus]OUS74875.1 hypothetical protein B1748_20040 [Paenibacillus sp. MY03]GBG10797.1 hypothetical protein PAT3040_05561 [Paenibacillus agaridevorans]